MDEKTAQKALVTYKMPDNSRQQSQDFNSHLTPSPLDLLLLPVEEI